MLPATTTTPRASSLAPQTVNILRTQGTSHDPHAAANASAGSPTLNSWATWDAAPLQRANYVLANQLLRGHLLLVDDDAAQRFMLVAAYRCGAGIGDHLDHRAVLSAWRSVPRQPADCK